MAKIVIAIDGPAGSGKSTTARKVAEALQYIYLDTGAMYRAITLAIMNAQCPVHEEEVRRLLETVDIRVEQQVDGQHTFLHGVDVSERIREQDVTARVSEVSALSSVRSKLVHMQQEMGRHGGIVMDGRDIGTVVFPKAELKIFMIASIAARAKRRLAESSRSSTPNVDEVALELERRDEIDSTRELSPLTKADDAVVIDTSDLSFQEQVDQIIALARERIESLTLSQKS